jgi:hypothetical protein
MEKRNALKVLSLSSLAFLVILMPAIAVQASTPITFGSPIKLGTGYNPNVQSVGSNVYVAWTDKTGGIFFRASANDGQTWGTTIKIGQGGQYPIMSVSGSQIYVVWSGPAIMFASSSDNGAHWTKAVKISGNGAITPFIASNGKVVGVVYLSKMGGGSNVTSSVDGGLHWTKPFQYSNGPEDQIAISGTNIFVSADALDRSHIQFAVSHNSGLNWTINSLEGGSESWIAASGSNVYAVWETKSPTSVIWFMSSTNNGTTLSTKIISTTIPDAWNPMINAIGSKVWVGIQELGGKAQNWMLTSSTGGATFNQMALTGTGHMAGFIFNVPTTDGTNVFAMWIQKAGSGSVAMVASSINGGNTWSVAQLGQSDPNNDVAIGSISSDGMHGLAAWDNSSTIWFSAS